MSSDRYTTLEGTTERTIREKASKFIGIALPVQSEADFKRELERVRNDHHGANHVCYAFILGADRSVHRSSDDGEPSGTAGAPILRALQAMSLTYAGVMVVRYFGGTLLGKGGLVQAYGDAARCVLGDAPSVVRVQRRLVRFTCSYPLFEVMKRSLGHIDGEVVECAFAGTCSGIAAIPASLVGSTTQQWRSLGIEVEAATC